jgi:pimeloyl-ACP methyl ester carboxylesterase
LLLHGTGASLHTWDGWAGPLSAQWRVVRLDLPGFGLTGPHPSGDYSPAATVDFLERFVNAAGLGRFAIAGNSLGGLVAWRFALRHPDRVTALILIDSAGYPADLSGPGTVGLRLARTPIVSELMRWAPVRAGVRNSLEGVYGSPEKVTPDLVDRYSDLLRRPGNRVAMGERARSMSNNTQWEQIQTIRIPTLIQWGGRDEWIPPVQGERFKRDIANSTLIVYPGLGHVPMEEDPQATVADAIAFLRKASGLRDSGRN